MNVHFNDNDIIQLRQMNFTCHHLSCNFFILYGSNEMKYKILNNGFVHCSHRNFSNGDVDHNIISVLYDFDYIYFRSQC